MRCAIFTALLLSAAVSLAASQPEIEENISETTVVFDTSDDPLFNEVYTVTIDPASIFGRRAGPFDRPPVPLPSFLNALRDILEQGILLLDDAQNGQQAGAIPNGHLPCPMMTYDDFSFVEDIPLDWTTPETLSDDWFISYDEEQEDSDMRQSSVSPGWPDIDTIFDQFVDDEEDLYDDHYDEDEVEGEPWWQRLGWFSHKPASDMPAGPCPHGPHAGDPHRRPFPCPDGHHDHRGPPHFPCPHDKYHHDHHDRHHNHHTRPEGPPFPFPFPFPKPCPGGGWHHRHHHNDNNEHNHKHNHEQQHPWHTLEGGDIVFTEDDISADMPYTLILGDDSSSWAPEVQYSSYPEPLLIQNEQWEDVDAIGSVVNWNWWLDDGTLNVGVVLFVALTGACVAVWSMLMAQCAFLCRASFGGGSHLQEEESQFLLNGGGKGVVLASDHVVSTPSPPSKEGERL